MSCHGVSLRGGGEVVSGDHTMKITYYNQRVLFTWFLLLDAFDNA